MHELPITESILEISLRHAREADASAITDINIVIGQLSAFVDESIQFYWDLISENTIAQGAALHFKRIPGEIRCLQCGATYGLATPGFICPGCGSVRGEITSGDQFYVESITIMNGNPEGGTS